MANIIEKSIDLGIGVFSYSKEKIEEVVGELVEKGDVSKNDAKELINELFQKGEEERSQTKKVIKSEIMKVLDSMDIARKDELINKDELRNIVRDEITDVLSNIIVLKKEGNNEDSNKE